MQNLKYVCVLLDATLRWEIKNLYEKPSWRAQIKKKKNETNYMDERVWAGSPKASLRALSEIKLPVACRWGLDTRLSRNFATASITISSWYTHLSTRDEIIN